MGNPEKLAFGVEGAPFLTDMVTSQEGHGVEAQKGHNELPIVGEQDVGDKCRHSLELCQML